MPYARQQELQQSVLTQDIQYLMDSVHQEEVVRAAGDDVRHRDGRVQHHHTGACVDSLID